jgi:WhiB family redox-sensing transcriptional regulator
MSDWKEDVEQALCAQVDPELFYPTAIGPSYMPAARLAKAICAECPIKIQCLERALKTNEEYGIWGGTTPRERQDILRRRRYKTMAI